MTPLVATLVYVAVAVAASGLFGWSILASQKVGRSNEIAQRITEQSYNLSLLAGEVLDGSRRAERQWSVLHQTLGEGLQRLERNDPGITSRLEPIQHLHEQRGEVFARLVSGGTANSWQQQRLFQQLRNLSSEMVSRVLALGDELRARLHQAQIRTAYLFAGAMILLLATVAFNHSRMSGLLRELRRRHDRAAALAEERSRQSLALQSEMERRQRAERQIIEAEKLASVGTLAAGVAHELNNPLMGVINYVEYCRDRLPEDDRKHGILDDAVKEARRCIDIVRDLLTFSRRGEQPDEALEAVDAEALMERVLRLLSYRSHDVKIETDLPPDLPRLAARPNKLQQVLLNVSVNALDALDALDRGAEKRLSVSAAPHGDWLDVLVSDNGPGIPRDRVARVFDPFYTTKEVGKGTGLGLPIARNLVEEMGGTLRLESEPGRGTTVTISLPLADNIAPASNPPV
ncbi:MAG: ATP-binding protein [Gammaproteobacteria bacterium]|nr:ATP-binding protein [Gammaproteobacteria bacterium]